MGKPEGKRFLRRPTVRRDREITVRTDFIEIRYEGDGLD